MSIERCRAPKPALFVSLLNIDVYFVGYFFKTEIMIGIEKPLIVDSQGELVINHDAIRGIEPFATLIKRQRKSKGDADGRKKIINLKELKYVYFMSDWDTYHRGLSDYDKPKKAKKDCGLPSNWSPDEVVTGCIAKYKEVIDYYMPSARILIAIEKGLSMSATAVESYIIQMETVIRMNNARLNDGKLTPEIAVEIMESNRIIQINITEILSLGTKLPKTIDGVTSLQDKVRKELGTAKKLQGDKIKRNREDPKK